MNKKLSVLFVEGYHEEAFIKDWRLNHGSLFDGIETKVISPGQIENHVISRVSHFDEIIFFVDKDDDNVNKKLISASVTCELEKVEFIIVSSDPEFETFCASCFEDFTINNSWDNNTIKSEVRQFLKNKDGSVHHKKWTYTDIKNNKGDIKNAKRYSERFKILEYL